MRGREGERRGIRQGGPGGGGAYNRWGGKRREEEEEAGERELSCQWGQVGGVYFNVDGGGQGVRGKGGWGVQGHCRWWAQLGKGGGVVVVVRWATRT